MTILPRGKYYYDLSVRSSDEIFVVAPSGTRYGFVEVVDEDGAEHMEIEPQGTSTYEPRPILQLRPMVNGLFVVEELTLWQKIKKIFVGFNGSRSVLAFFLWSIFFIVVFYAVLCVTIIGWWDFIETVLPFTVAPWWWLVFGVVGLITSRTKLLRNIFDG